MKLILCSLRLGLLLLFAGECAQAAPAATSKTPTTATNMVFNVRDYGAKGDGVTDDAEAIQVAIDAAAKAGTGRTVLIPAGKYYLGQVRDGRDKWSFFRLNADANKLTVEGEGPEKTVLLTSGASQPFVARGCSNCVLRNFSVDWKTLNFTQGVITSVDPGEGIFEVAIDKGYAPPDAELFMARDGYDPDIHVLTPGRNTFNWREQVRIESVENLGEHWRLHVAKTDPNSERGKLHSQQAGNRFFIWGHLRGAWTPLVTINDANNFSVENVNDYAGGGFQGGDGSRGTLAFTNYYSGPPAGSNRLGFYGGHQGHSRAAVVMTNCKWVMSNDDDVNELTGLDYIHEHPAPNTLVLARSADYQVGDKVSLWDYSDPIAVRVSATATITEITPLPNDEMRVVLDRDVVVKKTGRASEEKSGDDRMLGGRDRIVNLSSSGPWTMRNCTFNAAFAHPLLIKSYNGVTLENCRIYGSDMSGLESGMITFWNEGPQTCNITLRGNTFYDNDGISALIGIGAYRGNSTASHDQTNMLIENNLFLFGGRLPVWNGVLPRGVALMLSNTHTAVVRGNLFCGFPNANIAVYASDDVTIANNTFLRANERDVDSNNRPERENFNERTLIWINNSQNVAVSGNRSYLNGPLTETLVASGTNVSNVSGQDDGVKRANALTFDLKKAPLVNKRRAVAMQAPTAGKYRLVLFYSYSSPNGAPPFTLPVVRGQVVVNGKSAGAIPYENNGIASPETPDLAAIISVTFKAGRNTVSFDPGNSAVTLNQVALLLP